MKNEKLDEFLYKNRLKSADLVEFWGVSKGVVSQILNGTTKLPTKRLEELLNNPHGWDTSMLTERQSEVSAEEQPAAGGSLIEYLQRKVKELERENADLLQENAVLKYENRMLASDKREGAESAAGSLSVTA
jgi:hypothetical protein